MRKKGLQKSIEDFSRALEQGQAAVYRRNFDAETYEYMGGYIQEITGYAPKDLTPQRWDSLIVRAEQKGALAGLSLEECFRLNRTGEVDRWQADVQIRTRSGQLRWVADMSTVLRDESGTCYGCLGVLLDITDRKQAEEKLANLTEKLRLRNEEIEADLVMAREVQQALVSALPDRFPPDAGTGGQASLGFHHRYIPAMTLGGDFFNILPLSGHQVGVFICDVIGHGVRAALLTTFVRGLIEELFGLADDPGALLSKINHSLMAVFGQSESLLFASACYVVFDAATGRIRYANAGHPNPLLLQPAIQAVTQLDAPPQASEPALGIVEEFVFSTYDHELRAGESVLLYTDGLFEAYNAANQMYGEERLAACLRHCLDLAPDELLDTVIRDVHRFSGRDEFEDDVCLLAVVPSGPQGADAMGTG
jgi:sigma-B regulation protein RsbU (phosphoserine phosphatase)